MTRLCRWYWFHFTRRPLPVTIRLAGNKERHFGWWRIYGLQIGPWFIGAIKGSEAAK